MCQQIYIGASDELQEIAWDSEQPGFYCWLEENGNAFLETILEVNYLYQVGSFMGCSCGLIMLKNEEDTAHRIHDIRQFQDYLNTHSQSQILKVFSTSWSEFPESYPTLELWPEMLLDTDFELEEDVIYLIQTKH